MMKEMADGGSPDMNEQFDKASLDVTQTSQETKSAKAPAYRKPKLSAVNKLKYVASIGLGVIAAACGIKETQTPRSPSATPSEGIGGTPTEVLPTATAMATATETKAVTPTPEFNYAEINIFDEKTWPEKYQSFWDRGWLNSKEADRQDFQQFMEKSRAAFFAKEGMTDEVAKMTEIRPELRSLWGMIDYAETHKDEVIKNQTFIPVTPTELEWMMTDPALEQFPTWGEDILAWKGVILQQGGPRAVYGIHNDFDLRFYSSDNFGMPIAGKDGSVVVPRSPYDAILGDLAALGCVGGGENQVYLLLMNVLDKDFFHHLAAPAVSLDGNMVAPEGSPAVNSHGVVFLTQDRKIDQLQDYRGRKYTVSDMFELVGKNMKVNFLSAWDTATDTFIGGIIFEPKSKDDIATRLRWIYTEGDQDNWPWSNRSNN